MLGLAAFDAAPCDVAAAVHTTAEFLGDVHRIGTSVTLRHIVERTIGGDYWDGVWPVARALYCAGSAQDLTVGTLNYDGLLHSGLMEAGTNEWGVTTFPITDLADGRSASRVESWLTVRSPAIRCATQPTCPLIEPHSYNFTDRSAGSDTWDTLRAHSSSTSLTYETSTTGLSGKQATRPGNLWSSSRLGRHSG